MHASNCQRKQTWSMDEMTCTTSLIVSRGCSAAMPAVASTAVSASAICGMGYSMASASLAAGTSSLMRRRERVRQ